MVIRPEASRAVIVGIDEYAAGWSMAGPARDACLFAAMVIDRGVPRERVTLLLSPPTTRAADGLGVRVRPADYATVRSVLVDELSAEDSEFLVVHWGGHGVVDGADRRQLFCADATVVDKRNVDLNSLLAALRSTLYRHPRQAVLVDACQNHVENLRLVHELPSERFPRGEPRESVTQQVLMAASPGQLAMNERGTGLFSTVLREELASEPWPPDLDLVRGRVDRRFAELRATGRTRQVPTYLWSRGAGGENLRGTPARTRRLSIASVGELADLLLELDEFAHESTRTQLLLMSMPREIMSALRGSGPQKVQIMELLRSCERFAGGRAALLDAIRTAVPATFARDRVEEAFQRIWPSG